MIPHSDQKFRQKNSDKKILIKNSARATNLLKMRKKKRKAE